MAYYAKKICAVRTQVFTLQELLAQRPAPKTSQPVFATSYNITEGIFMRHAHWPGWELRLPHWQKGSCPKKGQPGCIEVATSKAVGIGYLVAPNGQFFELAVAEWIGLLNGRGDIQTEASHLSMNTMVYIDLWTLRTPISGFKFYILMHKALGDLEQAACLQVIQKNPLKYFAQMIKELDKLHSKNIFHGELTAKQFLLLDIDLKKDYIMQLVDIATSSVSSDPREFQSDLVQLVNVFSYLAKQISLTADSAQAAGLTDFMANIEYCDLETLDGCRGLIDHFETLLQGQAVPDATTIISTWKNNLTPQ